MGVEFYPAMWHLAGKKLHGYSDQAGYPAWFRLAWTFYNDDNELLRGA